MHTFTLIGLDKTTLKFSLNVEAESLQEAARKLRGNLVETPAIHFEVACAAAKLFSGRPHMMFGHGLATPAAMAHESVEDMIDAVNSSRRFIEGCTHLFLGEAAAS